jgi:hypothetical protein
LKAAVLGVLFLLLAARDWGVEALLWSEMK